MHFVICGGTGKQGRAAIDALLRGAKDVKITAMVRDPNSARSKDLEKIGCSLVKGDMADKESMVKAFSGADGVYVVTALEPFNQVGVDKEIVQGKTAVAALVQAKVPYVVFASVFGSHLKSGIPHFDSKFIIEEDLRASGLKYCILKPACFMDNMSPGENSALKQGVLQFLIDPSGHPLPLCAVEDIGEFAAMALRQPNSFAGKEIDLAGDCLTGEQMAATVSKVRGGEPWSYSQAPLWLLNLIGMHELSVMGYYFCNPGIKVDMAVCRALRPNMLTFEQYLIKVGYDKMKLEPAPMCIIS